MLILASNSPRRKQLLALGGWDFSTLTPEVDERVLSGESPSRYVCRLAELKARAAAALLGDEIQEAVILAADTTVINPLDGEQISGGFEILGKPLDGDEAAEMLRKLRGRIHQVVTGLALLRLPEGRLTIEAVATDVPMRAYTDQEIQAYIATSDPLDKAGAYAIQHPVFRPVQNLQGCYANVMGLPVCRAARALAVFGLQPRSRVAEQCQQYLDYPCPVFQQALEQEKFTAET
jgi:MAF protein